MAIEQHLTDIILCSSEDQEFHGHRLVLRTLYRTFAGLIHLNQPITRVEIPVVTGSTLLRVLKYIYTGEIKLSIGEFSIEEVRNLLNAAEFFELVQLKHLLIKNSLRYITHENSFELLQIVDDKHIKLLKNRILIFLYQQFPQVYEKTVDLQSTILRSI